MKVVILSAGQGRRLLPLTTKLPKCALRIQGRSLIEWQVDELAKCGIKKVAVVVGYGADQVQQILDGRFGPHHVRTIYNPDFAVADNLLSCWRARDEMTEDFILLNGDTLFEAAVVRRLLQAPGRPVTVVTDRKSAYDADDMKVKLAGERLLKIGKSIALDEVDAESIGMILFRGEGPCLFRTAIEGAVHEPAAQKKWYLSVIDQLAQSIPVWTCCIEGLQWCEVDYPADLEKAKKVVGAYAAKGCCMVGAMSNGPQRGCFPVAASSGRPQR